MSYLKYEYYEQDRVKTILLLQDSSTLSLYFDLRNYSLNFFQKMHSNTLPDGQRLLYRQGY